MARAKSFRRSSCRHDSKWFSVEGMQVEAWTPPHVLLTVDLVILTLRKDRLCVLLVERAEDPFGGMHALPGGFLNNDREEILDAARRELQEETALDIGRVHLEQFAIYGAVDRDPRDRVVSVAHLAIVPDLPEPVAGTDAKAAAWVPVEEVLPGEIDLAFDHHRIVTDGVERARSRLEFTALATAFCTEPFTIAELQHVYETVWGTELDTRNFYRKVRAATGFVVPDDAGSKSTRGRPAQLYRVGPSSTLAPPLTRPPSSEKPMREGSA